MLQTQGVREARLCCHDGVHGRKAGERGTIRGEGGDSEKHRYFRHKPLGTVKSRKGGRRSTCAHDSMTAGPPAVFPRSLAWQETA